MVLITIQIDSLEDLSFMVKHEVNLESGDTVEIKAAQLIVAGLAEMNLISRGDGSGGSPIIPE